MAAACGPLSGAAGARWRSWTRLVRLPVGAAVMRCGDGLTWPHRPLGGPMPWAAGSTSDAEFVIGGVGHGDALIEDKPVGEMVGHAYFRPGRAQFRGVFLAAARGPPSGVEEARWRSYTNLGKRPFGAAAAGDGNGLTWPLLPLGGPAPWAAWVPEYVVDVGTAMEVAGGADG